MRSVLARCFALGTVLFLSSSGGWPQSKPASSSPAPQDKNVADFEQRLNRINGQIKDLKSRLEAEARKESSVLSSLARINLNRSLVARELAAQNVELERGRSGARRHSRRTSGASKPASTGSASPSRGPWSPFTSSAASTSSSTCCRRGRSRPTPPRAST